MNTRSISGLTVVPLIVVLAACGGGSSNNGVASADNGRSASKPSPTKTVSAADAQVDFTRCMRANGVNIKDPVPGARSQIVAGARGDLGKLQAAQKKCQHFLSAGGLAPIAPDPKTQDEMVKFAECMRQQGVNVPDPKSGGGLAIQAQKGSQAKFQAAQKVCQHYLPGEMQGPGQLHSAGSGSVSGGGSQ